MKYPHAKEKQCDDCGTVFMQKLHTGRKYCDVCKMSRERNKWQRNRERMIAKGQFKGEVS